MLLKERSEERDEDYSVWKKTAVKDFNQETSVILCSTLGILYHKRDK